MPSRRPRRSSAVLAVTSIGALAVALMPGAAWAATYEVTDTASCQAFLDGTGLEGTADTALCRLGGTTNTLAAGDVVTFRDFSPSFEGPFTNDGALTVVAAKDSTTDVYTMDSVTNHGSLVLDADVEDYGGYLNAADGVMTVLGQYYNPGGGIRNDGRLEVGNGGLLDLQGELRNNGILAFACEARYDERSGAAIVGGAPVFACGPSAVTLTRRVVRPAEPSGSVVGALATQQDASRGPYAYRVVQGGDDFTVSGSSLVLARRLAAGSYPVTVRSADDHGAYLEQTFTVQVGETPSIGASAASRTGITVAGWSRSPVTVSFACQAGAGTTLPQGCPEPALVAQDAAGETVARTVTDSLGQSATASYVVRLDRTGPTLRVRGARDGATYAAVRALTCRARDALSGVRQKCRIRQVHVTSATGGTVVVWRAVVKDVAGNKTVRRGHYTVSSTPRPAPPRAVGTRDS